MAQDDSEIAAIQTAALCIAAISCTTSLAVLITYIIFTDMQKKMFMKFIFYISFSDFCMNIASLIGFPTTGSLLCWAQGIMQFYFSLASFFWTTMLSFFLYIIVTRGYPPLKLWQVHAICWLFPLVLTLIPLSTSYYGAPNSNDDVQWCLIVSRNGYLYEDSIIWSYASYYIWMMLSIFLMTYWQSIIYFKLKAPDQTFSETVLKCYDKVWPYPLAMTVCWFLNFVCTEFFVDALLVGLGMIFGISYGIFTSFIFFWKSTEAKNRWHHLFSKLCSGGKDDQANLLGIVVDFHDDEKLGVRETTDAERYSSRFWQSSSWGGSARGSANSAAPSSNSNSLFSVNSNTKSNSSSGSRTGSALGSHRKNPLGQSSRLNEKLMSQIEERGGSSTFGAAAIGDDL